MTKKAITIRDIARAVGVSEATVSLALNGSALIKEETREKVKQTAEMLGYVPNTYARRLVLKKSGVIGVVVPEIENVYYAIFVRLLSEKMAEAGYSLSIFISSNDPAKEERAVSDMIAARVEAMVYVPVNITAENEAACRLMERSGIPAVCATTQIDGMSCVRCDLEGGMRALMAHILQMQPKKICYFGGPEGVFALDCRKQAFLSAVEGQETEIEVRSLPAVDYHVAYEEAGTLLSALPDVIVCVNDFMALGVVNRLIEHGISVPRDVAVTGFDDSIFSIVSPVPLTTVRQDLQLMAEKTVELLLRMTKTPAVREVVRIPTELIVRKSMIFEQGESVRNWVPYGGKFDMKTYCNPLSIPDIPSGRWLDTNQTGADPRSFSDYRSISDPSVVYHNGKWILYPSYSVAYVTEDFVRWKHIDIGIPHLRYSPAVVQFRGKWYLNGHSMSELYIADAPTGPFTLCGHMTDCRGVRIAPGDGCFLADGDRLYFYWHGSKPAGDADVEYYTAIVGVELDPEKPWQMLHEPVFINSFDPNRIWQRMGEHHQNGRMGWVEGPWMKKIGNRYYLLYAACGTEYGAYTNGILYSDDGPLTGFRPQSHNDPFTEKRTGLVRGAGHGCLVEGPGGTLWTFYTNIFCYNHMYERRISMDPVGIDENGELYCPQTTEVPQYAPGELPHPECGNDTGWVPLTFLQRPWASSAAPGRDALYACDDNALSWWQPAAEDPAPVITWRLGHATRFHIRAVRLIWRDIGMEVLDGILPGAFRYAVEYAPDVDLAVWVPLIDASENTDDLCIDYKETEDVMAFGIRLRLLGAPEGITPGLVSLTAFGYYVCEKTYDK